MSQEHQQQQGISPRLRNFIIAGVALVVIVVILIGGYAWGWTWVGVTSVPTRTGYTSGKTLYDLLMAFGIPALIVGFVKVYLDGSDQKKTAADYTKAIPELLANRELPLDTRKQTARAQTLSTFQLLNRKYKNVLADFLQSSGYVNGLSKPALAMESLATVSRAGERVEAQDASFLSQKDLADLLS